MIGAYFCGTVVAKSGSFLPAVVFGLVGRVRGRRAGRMVDRAQAVSRRSPRSRAGHLRPDPDFRHPGALDLGRLRHGDSAARYAQRPNHAIGASCCRVIAC